MGINQGSDNQKDKHGKSTSAKPDALRKDRNIIPSDQECSSQALEESDAPANEIRILLLGVNGSGKSSVGNTLIGTRTFGGESIAKCNYGKCAINGRKMVIIDSPCLVHTKIAPMFLLSEVNKFVGLSSPGPHVCIFVVPCVDLSAEDERTMTRIQNAFFPAAAKNTIVVLTKVDELERKGETVVEYVSEAPTVVKNLIEKCDNRYVPINNITEHKGTMTSQNKSLLDMIECVLKTTNNVFYTNEGYKLVQLNLKSHKEEFKKCFHKHDIGINLLEQLRKVEEIRLTNSKAVSGDQSIVQEHLQQEEMRLTDLKESMIETVCDHVRDGIVNEKILPLQLNLKLLLTSGTRALGSFLNSFIRISR